MKKCPACAEEIQDAALVCKHCQRDVVPKPVKTSRGTWAVLVVIILVALVWIMSSDDPALAAFKAKREAWHARCDQYRTTPLTRANPEAMTCNDELEALMAEAKQAGWTN